MIPPDRDGLAHLAPRIARLRDGPVSTAIESMNGAGFVHGAPELYGWDVETADALKVKGLAPGVQDRPHRYDAGQSHRPIFVRSARKSRSVRESVRQIAPRPTRPVVGWWPSPTLCSVRQISLVVDLDNRRLNEQRPPAR
jgi:hypothetical protein